MSTRKETRQLLVNKGHEVQETVACYCDNEFLGGFAVRFRAQKVLREEKPDKLFTAVESQANFAPDSSFCGPLSRSVENIVHNACGISPSPQTSVMEQRVCIENIKGLD